MSTPRDEIDRTQASKPDPDVLLGHNFGFARARVINTALEVGVFDALTSGSATSEALAAMLDCDGQVMDVLVAALENLELVEDDGAGHVTLSPVAAAYLVRESPTFLGEHLDEVLQQWDRWAALTSLTRTGTTDAGDLGDLRARGRHTGMFAGSFPIAFPIAYELAAEVRLARGGRVLGVAAGGAEWPIALALHHPGTTYTVLDDPALLQHARHRIEQFGLGDRFTLTPATYDPIPAPDAEFDLVVLAHTGRFIGPEALNSLLGECARVARPSGELMVVDVMRQDSGEPALARPMIALSLKLNTSSGRLLDPREYAAMMQEHGFRPKGHMNRGMVTAMLAERT